MMMPTTRNHAGHRQKACAVFGMVLLAMSATACATQPVVTRTIYEDRSTWVALEVNPYAEKEASPRSQGEISSLPTPAMLKALLKGFRVEKDYNTGFVGGLMGRSDYSVAFVEAELAALTPHLAKGLAAASPKERVAYCMAVDYTPTERFITTGYAYIKSPYFYFKIIEYRTPVRVKSPATSTSEACRVKPIPGTKTIDRFFKLDYEPKEFLVMHSPLPSIQAGTMFNDRGEVVFKLVAFHSFKTPEAASKPEPSPSDAKPENGNARQQSTNVVPSVPSTVPISGITARTQGVEQLRSDGAFSERAAGSGPEQPRRAKRPKVNPVSGQ
jgi:hypothetical protein